MAAMAAMASLHGHVVKPNLHAHRHAPRALNFSLGVFLDCRESERCAQNLDVNSFFPQKRHHSVLGGHGAQRKFVYRSSGMMSQKVRSEAGAGMTAAAPTEVKVKVKVGVVGGLKESVFSFQKLFGPSSDLILVTLPKPLGIVFVESSWKDANGKHRVVVGELVGGGNAERAARISQLFAGGQRRDDNSHLPILNGGVKPGDILRATTTVDVLVDFFGIRLPQRVMDLYVVDGRPWHLAMRALNASFFADGPLTLVFERKHRSPLPYIRGQN